jgi:hypothetical protein
MPLVQGGPPEWIWERQSEKLIWELDASPTHRGDNTCELRIKCGLEIMRLQFFTREELLELKAELANL